ncbi:MAG TPA: ABC transporter substrate-binding protein [Nocardioides sp.]|nr:ABC transporter substrate-binding protein [Nocardioides sp.]
MPLTTTHRRRRLAATLALLFAAIAALTACSANAESGGANVVRYQSYAGSVDPLLFADALGKLDGVELKRVGDVTGGPQALQALVSHQTDIGSSAFYGAIAQLVSTGAPIKAVFPSYGANAKTNQKLVVLDSSGITDAKSLIGKRIAVNTLGANAEAFLDSWFQQQGLTADEISRITLVPLPPLNTPDALAKGQIDAAVVGFSAYQQLAAEYKVKEITDDVKALGGPYVGGAFTMRDDFIKDHADLAQKVVAGIAAAVQYIETHTKQQVFDIYFPYLKSHGFGDYIEAIQANYPGDLGLPAKPVIDPQDISRWTDWLEGRGEVKSGFDVSAVYTNDLNPNG